MLTKIRKRDGREVDFDSKKITDAVYKARLAIGRADYQSAVEVTEKVIGVLDGDYAGGKEAPTVESVQDVVEKVLMDMGHARTAKEYILYRAERTRIREMNTRLMQIYSDITFKPASDSDIKRENANIDGNTAMGTMLKYGSEGAKEFYGKFVLKPEHAKAHKEGDIHIHDLDFYTLTTTCCQIDIKKLFEGGFSTGHGHLREPNDIQSYAALACIAIQSNQNDQHGGQSIVNFDYGMSDGVKKTYKRLYLYNLQKALELMLEIDGYEGDFDFDSLKDIQKDIEDSTGVCPKLGSCGEYIALEAERIIALGLSPSIVSMAQIHSEKKADIEIDRHTYQAMEAFIHNLNTMHSRAGAQTPFSSINYGMDTSPEGRMIIKNILLATEAGLGHGETAIFPIQIFRVKKGVNYNPDDPNYDLLKLSFRVSAKRMYPNYSFQDAPYNLKYYDPANPATEIAYMGCRTRVMANIYDSGNEISHGRGNLSFTTINLPRIAIRANKNIDWFFEELERKLELVTDQLLERFEIQARKRIRNFPFLMGQGVWLGSENLGEDDELREILKHGTLSIGFIGLAECLKSLTGYHHAENPESRNLGLEIVGFMRRFTDDASLKYKLNVTLLSTPAEGLAGRFLKLDRELFGVVEGVTDREYYTNSFHVPVYHNITIFDKIQIEAPYHELTNAGHITFVELDGDVSQNLDVFERVIQAMYEAGIGYGSINHPIDRDPVCGYTGVINDVCPSCGRREGEWPHSGAAQGDGAAATACGAVCVGDAVVAGGGVTAGAHSHYGAKHSIKTYGAYTHKYAHGSYAPGFERIRRITGYLVGTLDRFNNAKRAEEGDRVKHNWRLSGMENPVSIASSNKDKDVSVLKVASTHVAAPVVEPVTMLPAALSSEQTAALSAEQTAAMSAEQTTTPTGVQDAIPTGVQAATPTDVHAVTLTTVQTSIPTGVQDAIPTAVHAVAQTAVHAVTLTTVQTTEQIEANISCAS